MQFNLMPTRVNAASVAGVALRSPISSSLFSWRHLVRTPAAPGWPICDRREDEINDQATDPTHMAASIVTLDHRIDQTASDGKTFAELFYQQLDKSRNNISGLYHPQASTLIWNGNSVTGLEDIIKFYEGLPPTETTLMTVDAQPIMDLPAFNGQVTMAVTCAGRMKIGARTKFFTESFLLVAENNKWKVFADTFRDFS